MTREIIEDFRFIVIPYMVNRFKEINYEGQGGSDAKEFMSNFNEICDLAIKALDQEPTDKIFTKADIDAIVKAINAHWELIIDEIRAEIETKYGHCSICEYDSDYDGRWYQVGDIADILQILDKYKAEREDT